MRIARGEPLASHEQRVAGGLNPGTDAEAMAQQSPLVEVLEHGVAATCGDGGPGGLGFGPGGTSHAMQLARPAPDEWELCREFRGLGKMTRSSQQVVRSTRPFRREGAGVLTPRRRRSLWAP